MLFTPAIAQAAPAAPANQGQCVQYVESKGYPVGEYTNAACQLGASGDIQSCVVILLGRQVDSDIANTACLIAAG